MEINDATLALSALGQSTRLSVFRLLVEAGPEGRMAGDIAEALSLPGATLSFHLKELGAAGLISGEQRGRCICYRARFDTMNALIEFLTRNCCGGTVECVPKAACK
ncbi:ArsR/SmtB family transcription factor [Marilutibacter alkalisoli]|uniref:Helix-turn-helix transcriptional regulator n=1 Tax=Marilutibacter alkalisoli TaxID=2591633 RepID=A0A514BWI6_9GAMM|nr:metalloregulator ArsR/SmtB family transcription factor [Lysobacter alkalisoli]QDH71747.1 helix-turn-helix transcriptional regulator [Lysobacter alkalisoli]